MNEEQDPRLTLSDTKYRMWNDSQNIQVPRGQSTTKKLSIESLGVNTRVYGDVKKSYFSKPFVNFYNTFKEQQFFDFFKLAIERERIDFTDDTISLINDVDIDYLEFLVNITFYVDSKVAVYTKLVKFYKVGNEYITDTLHFTDIPFLDGSFKLMLEPNNINSLKPLNHEFYFKIKYDKVFYKTNTTRAELLLNDFNNDLNFLLYSFEYEFKKGG